MKIKKQQLKLDKRNAGYTLIEVLMTIVILGVVLLMVNVVVISIVRNSYYVDTRMEMRQGTEFSVEVIRRAIKSADPASIQALSYNQNSNTFSSCTSACNALEFMLAETSNIVRIYRVTNSGVGQLKIDWGDGYVGTLTNVKTINVKTLTFDVVPDISSGTTKILLTLSADSVREKSTNNPIVKGFIKQATIITRTETL
ncbi:prepilin-type N-terminal cleavage/methylation domain-containing protein [Candidatus Dojkabacteria bacterium]|nr:prepilin-type N-terminal cleavage/methylation domain-containing protein [Candidatus Dojkabacteria bacterium]